MTSVFTVGYLLAMLTAINAGNQGLRAFFTSEEMASPIGPKRRNLLAEDLELRDSNGNLF